MATTKAKAIKNRYTQTQILNEIVEKTSLSKRQIKEVLGELETIMERHLKKGAAGQFVMPGLFKVTTVRKKATKARKGINPFTKEPTVFKAKPARTVVKIRPLKKLKDMVV